MNSKKAKALRKMARFTPGDKREYRHAIKGSTLTTVPKSVDESYLRMMNYTPVQHPSGEDPGEDRIWIAQTKGIRAEGARRYYQHLKGQR